MAAKGKTAQREDDKVIKMCGNGKAVEQWVLFNKPLGKYMAQKTG